jgi:DinB superfamily
MQYFPNNLFCTIRNLTRTWPIVPALMFRSIARIVVPVGIVSVSVLASLANAQIAPGLPNPSTAPNPLTNTLSLFRRNMQDKIMKAAEAMPESKYSYRPTKDARSFAEILNHVADISYFLCSNAKGEAPPPPAAARGSKTEIIASLKAHSTTAMARSPGSPMCTSMTRRTSLATGRTRCSS